MELEQLLKIADLEKYPEFFVERSQFSGGPRFRILEGVSRFRPHPTEALIEAVFSNLGALEDRFGEAHAFFLYGYIRGHISQCSPCDDAVTNEILKHPGEVF